MPSSVTQVYIGLGSNLGDSVSTLRAALVQLGQHSANQQLIVSPVYRSKPVGPQNQPDYWNAVATFKTTLSAVDVLALLLQIEQAHGRQRSTSERWGARTLDLDVLLYGRATLQLPHLTIPHPHLTERAFVLRPLLDLEPLLTLPSGHLLNAYLKECLDQLHTLQRTTVILYP